MNDDNASESTSMQMITGNINKQVLFEIEATIYLFRKQKWEVLEKLRLQVSILFRKHVTNFRTDGQKMKKQPVVGLSILKRKYRISIRKYRKYYRYN